ncbi:capsular polysaccharide biosynthesis protein [Oxalobacteraceae bacterium R-40]|uniref:Capsular polysaccharide biosynthesis protein n=1 Tax=Keguizhuia sedimenti TaxID=3064264 RepID=A0ABU1BTC8_9BURK|nr:capsular polysaccharide biosynthesis protein [Oxalobacteraceae bacterium R-40]
MPYIEALLGANVGYAWPWIRNDVDAVLAWGRKPSSRLAHELAGKLRVPLLRAEDGFLRSVGHGKKYPAYSLVIDKLGIYYDASRTSDLEKLIKMSRSDGEFARARQLIQAWRKARISKYNHAREAHDFLNKNDLLDGSASPFVLLVDQTFNDASVRYGCADKSSFQKMLRAAMDEHPDCRIVVKTHPEVATGRKRGYLDNAGFADVKRIVPLREDVHPVLLIEHAKAIYTVTSQIGFEALLWGKRIRTFGMPFYAGWGLTHDELAPPERRCPVPLENLVYAALCDYARYIDPETGKACDAERLIEWMALQRNMRARFAEKIYAIGFPAYKHPVLRRFTQGSEVHFQRREGGFPAGSAIAVWGKKTEPENAPHNRIRVEDGFIRSVGLGAELVPPMSLILDKRGIHYDPRSPSDLECLLQEHTFDEAMLERARALVNRIISFGITKYNVGVRARNDWRNSLDAARIAGKRVILVPGQVESDASVIFGTKSVRTNAGLLRKVRHENPAAYIVYKPHPDVLAGLRRDKTNTRRIAAWCDETLPNVALADLLPWIDEVHAMTSLAGFEALLRGKVVVCYGQPFYSGWGLTRDIHPIPRRTRKLSIPELAAGALIMYPTYISRTTKTFTTPERVIEELVDWQKKQNIQWFRIPLRLFLAMRKY